jgi:hypothetical protein
MTERFFIHALDETRPERSIIVTLSCGLMRIIAAAPISSRNANVSV